LTYIWGTYVSLLFMIKYIATDLDGTLFYPTDRKNMIDKANLFYVQSFIDGGGKLIIISGRSIRFGENVMKRIGRKGVIVGYNGAVISVDGQIVKSYAIPKDELSQIITEFTSAYKIMGLMLFCNDAIYFHAKKHKRLYNYAAKIYCNHQGNNCENIVCDDNLFKDALENKNVYKLMFFIGITLRKQRQAMELNKILRNAYTNLESSWSNQVIEVTSKGCSKGEALKEYAQYANIKDDEIAVVGDSGNDISMFKEYPDNSFCMEHAPKSIQKYAKYTISKFEDLSRYLTKK